MHAYRIYVGTKFDKDGKPITSVLYTSAVLDTGHRLGKAFGGFTVFQAKGAYTHQDGRLVTEDTLVYEVFAELPARVIREAQQIRAAFRQESVVLVHPNNSVTFLY